MKKFKLPLLIILLLISVYIPINQSFKSNKLDEHIENINSSINKQLQIELVQKEQRNDIIYMMLFNKLSQDKLQIDISYLNKSSEGKQILKNCPDLNTIKCANDILSYHTNLIELLISNVATDQESLVKALKQRENNISDQIIFIVFSIFSTLITIWIGFELSKRAQ